MKNYMVELTPGEELFLWRLRRGLTIGVMSRRVCYARETYSKIERDEVGPAYEKKVLIEKETDGKVPVRRWMDDYYRQVNITPNEHLVVLIRRTGMNITKFCRKAKVDNTRVSSIIHGRFTPSEDEQVRIERFFPELKGAWRKA